MRLADLRAPLINRLRRWCLPYAAVFQSDLAALARSWVLRAWLMLTVVVALVTMLDPREPVAAAPVGRTTVLAALFQPADAATGEVHMLRELLKFYVFVWSSFAIVLTAGTVSSEIGVLADSVLSRGVSRWQYYFGKWSARLAAILGVYLIVMVPTASVLWLGAVRPDSSVDVGAGAAADSMTLETVSGEYESEPAPFEPVATLRIGGVGIALAQVGLVLVFVATCGVAYSASFGSSVISIAVGWVSLYSSGLILSILDISRFSPARLVRELPDLLSGRYTSSDQWGLAGGWLIATFLVLFTSAFFFSRRDV